MCIRAECYSDDRCVEVEFDATPWFNQASDEQIVGLANIGWGGDYASDYVAEYCGKTNKNIQDMFEYIALRQRIETIGFECHVNEDDAMEWIKENRNDLIALI